MVFSSIPAYLDPSNWQQQQNHQIIGSSSTNPLHPPPPAQPGPPPPPPPQPHGGGATGSIRPNSMVDRARLANIPMPEAALKCPRCESTNTKFCYFNNYSLSQPRHFCKTCRRYWTRGGALRNVPVGGGCRRNKRSKSTGSKSSPASSDRQTNPSSTTAVSDNSWTANTLGLPPQLPLSQLTDNFNSDVGLNYSGITSPAVGSNEMSFHGSGGTLLGGSAGGVTPFLSSGGGGIDPWWLHQVQQFPYLSGLGPSRSGIVEFQGGESGFVGGETSHQARPRLSGSMLTQLASVKMEGNPELNLSRQLLEGMPGNDQWNTTPAAWTELSGFSSSSRTNPL